MTIALRRTCSVRLPLALWRRLKVETKRTGMKISALVELALIRELERLEREMKK